MGLSDNFILGEYIYKQADLMISESIFFSKAFMSMLRKHTHLSVI